MLTLNEVLFRLTCLGAVIGSIGLLSGLVFLGRKLWKRWKQARQLEREMGVGNIHPRCKHGTAKPIKCDECRKEAEAFFGDKMPIVDPLDWERIVAKAAERIINPIWIATPTTVTTNTATSLPWDALQNPYPNSRCLYCGHPEANHSFTRGCHTPACNCIAMKG